MAFGTGRSAFSLHALRSVANRIRVAVFERSAGVVVFREDPHVPGGRSFLLLDYGRFWDYPKGHVEKGEDDESAALRELAEETGIRDARLVDGFRESMTYFFRDARRGLIRKQVIFFLARTQRKRAKISHEHSGYAFLPFDQALDRLTYPSAKAILRQANAFLKRKDPATAADTSERRKP
jgi:8-oxo-dGTP pyrophosphatase MutT (NUDIX family)